jgi:plasmid replication initiation protein
VVETVEALKKREKHERNLTRNYPVVKANALIQKTRYNLTLQEQKLVLHIIQLIQPKDDDFKKYVFSVREYCQICEIAERSGKNYQNIKKSLKTLSDKSFWLTQDDDTETLMRWIDKVKVHPRLGTIEVKLDSELKPYLLQLKKFYTKYNYLYVSAMRSEYSIRFYELLKSYENQRQVVFSVEEIRKRLQVPDGKLPRWQDVRRRVIDQSQKEINELTDIQIKYETLKKGRKIEKVLFSIFTKDGKQQVIAQQRVERRLRKVKDDYPF